MNEFYPPVTYGYDTSFNVGLFIGFLIVVWVAVLISLAATVIFKGIGLLKMHQKLGINNGWMSFVPYLNSFAFGRVAEKYVREDGKKSLKYSLVLLISTIIVSVLSGFCSLFSTYIEIIALYVPASVAMIISIIFLLFALFFLAVAIVYAVFYYIALWRIYSIFANSNATFFLVLSILVPISEPIIIFAIRNKEPLCVEITVEEPIIEAIPEVINEEN